MQVSLKELAQFLGALKKSSDTIEQRFSLHLLVYTGPKAILTQNSGQKEE